MAKARSRRTMRNRKSRNRRGGLFGLCLNCSPEKKMFKELNEPGNVEKLCEYIVSLVNNSPDKIPSLYNELNDHDKDALHSCIVKGLMKQQITNDKLRDLSLSYTNKTMLDEAQQRLAELAPQAPQALPFGFGSPQQALPRESLQSDTVLGPQRQMVAPGGFFKPKSAKPLPTNVEAFQNQVANNLGASSAQGGGKSRRRHRRGRTLHKRRKSRKVRKTRCRRK